MRVLVWFVRALLLFWVFCVFAFTLNNQHVVTVHWFFGHAWTAPVVIVVLAAFALGAALSMLALAPAWWRRRTPAGQTSGPPAQPAAAPQADLPLQPPRAD